MALWALLLAWGRFGQELRFQSSFTGLPDEKSRSLAAGGEEGVRLVRGRKATPSRLVLRSVRSSALDGRRAGIIAHRGGN